ncbi:KpsF/GutQ family protein [Agrobacterium rubi TR3 = NBRC 13261]|uniref:KpsF/GutQ family protein n=1 Tax=Agrobacterium rubi TR3 = NBRC 13261 TaxID=1368415 RepID=A0A081CQ75_9HYPH|nr:KpsF/GutQ family sugar-phosphate isomerase [Agrobacterium rubi]MBP1877377.1 arabinose-5-phosphate isomerase [Agrobacterium rubi]MCL6651555.1 D-arabinose 5-phosphate [Agrobacterium rubi]GAK68821.1 KpsF/GutQ family protein [Agrobacterium rubi TR3 = NBRC 13261]
MITRAVTLVENHAVESALRTIFIEKNGLSALEGALQGALGAEFCRAIDAIGKSGGRLIITGVGKSGHIGSKLAATFASTGTPAFFVHAAEANHGDLGMIGGNDVVLAISKGGESAELRSIINYTRRFSIPLIAMTCTQQGSLAKASDIVLLIPDEQEACPHGLAPTTSTMMQLALGDALAIALLEARSFTAGDFRVFHPGGKLGASLTLVGDIMHTGERLPLVPKGTSMPEAVGILARKHFGCVAVLDQDGRLCGIVTEGDMARNLTRNLSELSVDDVMTTAPKVVKKNVLATAALATLEKHHIGALIVVDDDNRPIGLVHFHDLLRIGVA